MNRGRLGFSAGDSDEELSEDEKLPKTTKKIGQKNNLLAQSIKFKQQNVQRKQIKDEDSEVYQYDELYDEIRSKRENKLLGGKKAGDPGPKYMEKLLEAKHKREQDKLLIQDLKIQRERDLEGDEFKEKDKEVFITGAYKEHREKLQGILKEEDKEDDVTDMKDFHRAILNDEMNQSGEVPSKVDTNTEATTEVPAATVSIKPVSRERETEHVLNQIEELTKQKEQQKSEIRQFKSRLLPKLTDLEVEEARQRYLQRKTSV